MGLMVYFAYPIDNVDPERKVALLSDVQYVRNWMSNQYSGVLMYEPGRAWSVYDAEPDPRLTFINNTALMRADAVFALLPPDYNSVGVPYEIALAQTAHIPVVVVRAHQSWILKQAGIHREDTLDDGLLALTGVLHGYGDDLPTRPGPPRMQYKLTEDGAKSQFDPAPRRGYPDDAGFDLIYCGDSPMMVFPGQSFNVPAGVAIEWPENVWGLLIGRSSTFHKKGLFVNTAVIDPGYRGDMFCSVRAAGQDVVTIEPGERIAQIIPLPALATRMEVDLVDELTPTERADKGFGSSGK